MKELLKILSWLILSMVIEGALLMWAVALITGIQLPLLLCLSLTQIPSIVRLMLFIDLMKYDQHSKWSDMVKTSAMIGIHFKRIMATALSLSILQLTWHFSNYSGSMLSVLQSYVK